MPNKTLAEQIACAGRELALRKNVYPKWVGSGRLKGDKAHHEIECMEAIIESLKMLVNIAGKAIESAEISKPNREP